MADEWGKLALAVRATLLQASASHEATRLIDLATIKLMAQREALRANRAGVASFRYVELGPAGVSPASLLEAARRVIQRCSVSHGLADSALPLCLEGLGLVLGVEAVQSWATHSSNALTNAEEAQVCLRNGVSFATAAIDAVGVATPLLPAGVILQWAWLIAAEQLQNKAIKEVCLARNHLREMRADISRLLMDARSIAQLLD
jgi:hypothetical protein